MSVRALIFSLAYYPDLVGGAEVAVKEITDRIPNSDIDFHMVTLRTRRGQLSQEKLGAVTVHRIGFPSKRKSVLFLNKHLYVVVAPMRALLLHRTHAFDFTWSILASYAGAAGYLFKLLKRTIPHVLTLQEGDPIEYIIGLRRVRLVLPFFRSMFARADKVQAISAFLADFGRSMGAREPVVVPNGVSFAKFANPADRGTIARIQEELGKQGGDVFLVTASRLVRKNGIEDIIRSLSHLPKEVKLLIIGTGELEPQLRALVEQLGLASRVIFKGYLPHEELPPYLQACDIFVRPSLSEGFGNSFLEAMAAGLPVVATPVGGIPDFLKDKETGLFCAVSDPCDLAQKVEIYIRDLGLREEIIENGRRLAKDRYDWGKIVGEMRSKVFDPLLRRS